MPKFITVNFSNFLAKLPTHVSNPHWCNYQLMQDGNCHKKFKRVIVSDEDDNYCSGWPNFLMKRRVIFKTDQVQFQLYLFNIKNSTKRLSGQAQLWNQPHHQQQKKSSNKTSKNHLCMTTTSKSLREKKIHHFKNMHIFAFVCSRKYSRIIIKYLKWDKKWR